MSLQDTISKFQTLPPNIQQALSSDEAMAKMESLENKYNLKLASFVLRAAVREFPFEDLGIIIRKELNLKPEQAGLLKDELLDQILRLCWIIIRRMTSPIPSLVRRGKGWSRVRGRTRGSKRHQGRKWRRNHPRPNSRNNRQFKLNQNYQLPTTNYQPRAPSLPNPQIPILFLF